MSVAGYDWITEQHRISFSSGSTVAIAADGTFEVPEGESSEVMAVLDPNGMPLLIGGTQFDSDGYPRISVDSTACFISGYLASAQELRSSPTRCHQLRSTECLADLESFIDESLHRGESISSSPEFPGILSDVNGCLESRISIDLIGPSAVISSTRPSPNWSGARLSIAVQGAEVSVSGTNTFYRPARAIRWKRRVDGTPEQLSITLIDSAEYDWEQIGMTAANLFLGIGSPYDVVDFGPITFAAPNQDETQFISVVGASSIPPSGFEADFLRSAYEEATKDFVIQRIVLPVLEYFLGKGYVRDEFWHGNCYSRIASAVVEMAPNGFGEWLQTSDASWVSLGLDVLLKLADTGTIRYCTIGTVTPTQVANWIVKLLGPFDEVAWGTDYSLTAATYAMARPIETWSFDIDVDEPSPVPLSACSGQLAGWYCGDNLSNFDGGANDLVRCGGGEVAETRSCRDCATQPQGYNDICRDLLESGLCELPVDGYERLDGCLEFGALRAGRGTHLGDDFCASAGTDVHAISDGVVKAIAVRETVDGNWGPILLIEHQSADGDPVCVIYGHCEARPGLRIGDRVIAGERIATIHDGTPDLASWSNHIHFGSYDGPCAEIPCTDSSCAAHGYSRNSVVSGRYIDPIAFTNDQCSTNPSTSSLHILHPIGGESRGHMLGQSIALRWSSVGVDGPVNLRMHRGTRLDGSDPSIDIAVPTENDGEYTGLVLDASVFTPGEDWYWCVSDPGGSAWDCSGRFSINDSSSLAVVNPSGEETFAHGDTVELQWMPSTGSDHVNVRFHRGSGRDGSDPFVNVEAPGSNDGSVLALLDRNVFAPGDDWYWCVNEVGGSAWDCSEHFSIRTSASLEVTSPQGREVFVLGSTISLAWVQNEAGESVNIRLHKGPRLDGFDPAISVEAPGANDGNVGGVVLDILTFVPGDDWYWCVSDAVGSAWACSAHFTIAPCQADTEVCDGLDNDCDGLVDNAVPARDCMAGCGMGVETCQGGTYSTCQGPEPQPCVDFATCTLTSACTCPVTPVEVCNGLDDDCDASVDERRLLIELSASAQGTCASGWEIVVWDGVSGMELPRSAPGGILETLLPTSYACSGTLSVGAFCQASSQWRTWTPWLGEGGDAAGFSRIVLEDTDVVGLTSVCNFFPTCSYGAPEYWTTPRVPLDAAFEGTCDDVAPTACPTWCDGDDALDPLCI